MRSEIQYNEYQWFFSVIAISLFQQVEEKVYIRWYAKCLLQTIFIILLRKFIKHTRFEEYLNKAYIYCNVLINLNLRVNSSKIIHLIPKSISKKKKAGY